MKKYSKIISIVMALVLTCSVQFVNKNDTVKANSYGLSNPRVTEDSENIYTTWDSIYFGSYPQGYSYEEDTPIRWRVLSVDGNEALLLSDKILDFQPFDYVKESDEDDEDYDDYEDYYESDKFKDVTWEDCSLRKWLNNDFYNKAFSESQKSAIMTSDVVSDANPKFHTKGGNDTRDNVYLLSIKEATNPKYGFNSEFDFKSGTRSCDLTTHVIYDHRNGDGWYYTSIYDWWLRTPGDGLSTVSYVNKNGDGDYYGLLHGYEFHGIRPAIRIDLSKSAWEKGSTISCTDNKEEINTHNTTKTSILKKTYSEIFSSFSSDFNKYAGTINKSKDIIIPGLERTNIVKEHYYYAYVPQGVCVTDKYILISAYCQHNYEVNNSVIYVMKKSTGKYLKTLVLNTDAHVGAMAWNKKKNGIVYIAGKDDTVLKLKLSDIDNSANEDAVFVPTETIDVPMHPSFLTYYGGYLFVGLMNDTKKGKNVEMVKCDKNGNIYDNTIISMENKTQGISFEPGVDGKDYLVTSLSIGRNNDSQIKTYKTNVNSCVRKYKNEKTKFDLPCMSEDVDVNGGLLYTCFESASTKYYNFWDTDNNCKLPIDRVLVSYVKKITGVKNGKSKLQNDSEDDMDSEELASGNCGEMATWILYSDGSFVISGSESISDYDNPSDAPWSSYSDEIKNIVIGADINAIGTNAFSGLSNLESVSFSDMMNDQETFAIKAHAFSGCINLMEVSIPNIKCSISETAFDGCNKLKIKSDSTSVNNYCKEKSISVHNHMFKYIQTIKPTCLDDGYDVYRCECGEEDLRNTKLASDNHNYILTGTYSKTKLYTCSKCGSQYEVGEDEDEDKYEDYYDEYRTNQANKRKTITNNKTVKIKKIKSKKRALKIKWNRVKGINGYQIKYSLKKNFKKGKTVGINKAKTTSKTIKKLKRKKKYYLKMRTFIFNSGIRYYSIWSKTKSKKTK